MAPAVSSSADGRRPYLHAPQGLSYMPAERIRSIVRWVLFMMLVVTSAVTAFAQSTTGTVTMSATVSKFVEVNSGGAVTLTGNSGGGVTTDGVSNSPLAVSINLGELGPSNTNS